MKYLTTHDLATQRLTEEWVDPAQQLAEQARTRKLLAINAALQEIERLKEQVAKLRAELNEERN